MNFLIFRDFSTFFMNLFLILSVKNNLKRGKKGLIFAQDPRGCDVALKATWQSQADPRERLCGAM